MPALENFSLVERLKATEDWFLINLSKRSRRYDYIKNRIKKGYISLEQSTEVQPLADCKGRALRKVQEKDSARVKGEAP